MSRQGLGSLFAMAMLVGAIGGCSPTEVSFRNDSTTFTTEPVSLTSVEQSVYEQINDYRSSVGLPTLKLDTSIVRQARQHSEAMAQGMIPFGHQGFEQRVKAIGNNLAYRRAAENVAINQGYAEPAAQAVQGWLDSPQHRDNIRGQFDLTGVGVAKNGEGKYYFTQIFVQGR